MEGFLNKNPGLRSRIAFHVPFSDYDTKDLCSIADLLAKDMGLSLTEDAKEKLSEIFDTARLQPDFGNGRFARNIIEKARFSQAQRLLSMDISSIKNSDLSRLCASDIQEPERPAAKARQIGFAC